MFPIGIQVTCMIEVLISLNGVETFIVDGKAKGRVVGIEDNSTLIVNFSQHAKENGYIGDYKRELVFQKKCVPMF